MKDLVLFVVPNIELVSELIHPLETTAPIEAIKGISYHHYIPSLLHPPGPPMGTDLIICPEQLFSLEFGSRLEQIVARKKSLFLSFHKACNQQIPIEKLIHKTVASKLHLPIVDEDETNDFSALNLLNQCLSHISQSNRIAYNQSIEKYTKKFHFSLQLEVGFRVAHLHQQGEPLKTLKDSTNVSVLDTQMKEKLEQAQIKSLFESKTSKLTDNQLLKLCDLLFKPD